MTPHTHTHTHTSDDSLQHQQLTSTRVTQTDLQHSANLLHTLSLRECASVPTSFYEISENIFYSLEISHRMSDIVCDMQ